MFSGGDSSEGLNSMNQLGAYGFVNQIAVSNAMASGKNIDWAQLAQQWIQMRDNAASDTRPTSNMNEIKTVDQTRSEPIYEEKGEADMDMDDEEQQIDEKLVNKFENNYSSSTSGLHHSSMNQPWFFNDGTSSHLEPQSTSSNQWCTWSNQDSLQQQPPINSNINNPSMSTTSHIPSLLKMNVPHPNEIRTIHDVRNQPENVMNVMDSAKRKVLPAWIREGLEKMEREKQRQLEKEKQKNQVNSKWSDGDDDDSENINVILSKSQAYAKGDEEENLDEETSDNESNTQNIEANSNIKESSVCSEPIGKTYEQKLEDLMTIVRRTLTELLLETTNEEISKVAEETVKLFKSKASSAQVIQKSALSTITGKLGLAAYADSSSDENSDDEDSCKKETYRSDSEIDSEEELMNTIRTKRRAFVKISDDIEERVSLAAAREEEKLKYFLRKEEEEERENKRKKQEQSLSNEPTSSGYIGHNNKGYEKDFGEITETKIQSFNGKRQKDRNSRKERTTRFSDNKDSKYVALPATASFIANINVTGATGSGSSTATTAVPNTNQRQNIPDINGLLPNYTSTGMKNVLNAADAALEKVLKRKTSESPKKHSKRYERSRDYTPMKKRHRRSSSRKHSRSRSKSTSSTSSSSSTSTSSSDSDSSTSRSSNHSKYSHRSSAKHKSHSSSSKKYNESHKDHKDRSNYASSSNTKKERGSTSASHHRRNASSDSDEEYSRRRRHDSHYSRNSSYSRSYNSSRHDRDHSRSLSKSSYSSSNNRRQ